MVNFRKWTSLNSFHEVAKSLSYQKHAKYIAERDNKLSYVTKIKLHGTNASVTITSDGEVRAGKRTQFMPVGGVGGDNAGFAAWVERNSAYFASLAVPNSVITIYGEWCGPGVQSGVSCSLTDHKIFYIFSVHGLFTNPDEEELYYDPIHIGDMVNPKGLLPNDIIILPIHASYDLDFGDKDKLATIMATINDDVEAIGVCDPFIKENFEIEGAGEGLVFYPDLGGFYSDANEIEIFNVFNFKAKSEHHRVNKTKAAIVADPEVLSTRQKFGEMFCTEARFEQAFTEAVDRQCDLKLIPDFIKWCQADVYKESETERALMNVEWKTLAGVVASQAVAWYKEKINRKYL